MSKDKEVACIKELNVEEVKEGKQNERKGDEGKEGKA